MSKLEKLLEWVDYVDYRYVVASCAIAAMIVVVAAFLT